MGAASWILVFWFYQCKTKGTRLQMSLSNFLEKKIKTLFLIVIFFLVWMVIAVFALVIANLFISFPSSVIPVNFEIIIALLIGSQMRRRKFSLTLPSILAQIMLFVMIYIGTILSSVSDLLLWW